MPVRVGRHSLEPASASNETSWVD